MNIPLAQLEDALGYVFRRKKWLETALIHPSYKNERADIQEDNQRLEFLGDAVLNLLAAEHLFQRFPQHTEGKLTQMRSRLINRHTLYHVAQRLRLEEYMLVGKGLKKDPSTTQRRILADALEAVIGAVYQDGGLAATQTLFTSLFSLELEALEKEQQFENPKGTLQQIVSRLSGQNPEYRVVELGGPPHQRTFTCEVIFMGQTWGRGVGSKKRVAEAAAAEQALQKLSEQGMSQVTLSRQTKGKKK